MFDVGQRLEVMKHGNMTFLTVESVTKSHVVLHDDRNKSVRFKYPKAFFLKCKKLYRIIR